MTDICKPIIASVSSGRLRRSAVLMATLLIAFASSARAQEGAKFNFGPGEARYWVGAGVDRDTAAAAALSPLAAPPLVTWDGDFEFNSTPSPLRWSGPIRPSVRRPPRLIL